MQDFLDSQILFIAYYIYKQLEAKPKEDFWLTAHHLLTENMEIPFETEEEKEYWLECDCHYFNDLPKIFELLQNRFALKYRVVEDKGYLHTEDIYGNDTTPDKYLPEILDLMFSISIENDNFIQAFDDYIDDYCKSQLTGIDILNFTQQSKIAKNVINEKFNIKGNPELILTCKELKRIEKNNKIRLLEYLIQAAIYQKYEIIKLTVTKENSRKFLQKSDDFCIIARMIIPDVKEDLKNIIYIDKAKKTIKYCNKIKKLEPKQLNVILGIKNLSKNLSCDNNFIENLKKTTDIESDNTLQNKISVINKFISVTQNALNIMPNPKFIISNKEHGKAVNYYFDPFYKVQIFS